jgi:ribosomal protein L12E/L44/L45/RPP1/RPP2
LAATFTIDRLKLKKLLAAYKVSDKNIDEILNTLNKTHRHMNAVAFVSLLERKGLKRDDAINILRRIGVDDVNITSVLNVIDEQRIKDAYGKIVELSVNE